MIKLFHKYIIKKAIYILTMERVKNGAKMTAERSQRNINATAYLLEFKNGKQAQLN